MCAETASNYWKATLTHEAGHATAALLLHNVTADIFVKPATDGVEPFFPSFRWGGSDWGEILARRVDLLHDVIALAAGAKAEFVCLGIAQSGGFGGDRQKIYMAKSMLEARCTEAYYKKFMLPEDEVTELLAWNKRKLEELVAEIDSDYSRTVAFLEKHRNVIQLFESEALRKLESIGTSNLTDGTVLLSGARMRELWENESGLQRSEPRE